MHVALAVAVALGCLSALAAVLRGAAGRQRATTRGGIVSGFLQRRHEVRMEHLRHILGDTRDERRHQRRMREQAGARQARPGSSATAPDVTPDVTADGPAPQRTIRIRGVRLRDEPAAPGGPATPPAGTPRQPAPQDPATPPRPPARGGAQTRAARTSRPAPAAPLQPTGGTSVTVPDAPLSVPGVEMIIEGDRALAGHAMSGNVEAKRAAILGIGASLGVHARTLTSLATAMAEPDQHYGPEVWEPLQTAAGHVLAAATVLAETDSRLLAIVEAMKTLREAGVQAPHHAELSETGAR